MASEVFIIEATIGEGAESISEKARKLFEAGQFADCFDENDFTAIKVHVGEEGNTTYIPAACLKCLVDELLALKAKPFLTDTNALYVGQRHNAVDHSTVAARHGFGVGVLGIPFIVADGLFGTSEVPVKIHGELHQEVFIGSEIVRCQSILSIAHFTGHPATCAAATLKTLGMGCASKKGKLTQHSSLTLSIGKNCTLCEACVAHCPAGAITLGRVRAHIDKDKCIRCAACLAACRFDAVKCNWGAESESFQSSIAEHALGALKGKQQKAAFFNFLINITKDCDCFDAPKMRPVVDDIGILASTDPVAVDKASMDLVEGKARKKLAKLIKTPRIDPACQTRHAERIGLGTTDYELVEVR